LRIGCGAVEMGAAVVPTLTSQKARR
jgi:hypothetical protein